MLRGMNLRNATMKRNERKEARNDPGSHFDNLAQVYSMLTEIQDSANNRQITRGCKMYCKCYLIC